jgi:pyruvate dehydrogenase E1 component alpha subunit/2-oxoisovalerate dehydrogenase E1 component alpha subunit
MIRARSLEAKLGSLYKAGQIVGGVYIGKGQEAVSGALGAALERGRDIFAPLIRDQAGRTAFGEDMLDATRTYLGSIEGPMRGRDGNVHRGRPTEGMPAMISHLGSLIPVVAGMLMARRLKGDFSGCVGATSIGDGATSTGAFHEGLNLAAVEKLPFILVIANNQFAYSTPTVHQFACASLVDRAIGYGVQGHEVDGTSMMACVDVMRKAVANARAGEGPQMVVASMLRLSGHGEHDDGFYVPESLRASHLGADCMEIAEREISEAGLAGPDEIAEWKRIAKDDVQTAVATAQREAKPDPFQEDWNPYSTPGMTCIH